jgi:hypothetical protein
LEIPIIPAGGLYTSANDMARFIQFHLNRGTANSQSVLSPALLDEMYTVPFPVRGQPEGYALGIVRSRRGNERKADILMHGGGGFGFLSDMFWFPELKIGIAVLTNSTDHNLQGDLALQIIDDFIHDPGSLYYDRMMALEYKTPVYEGDGHYRPPAGLPQSIARLALETTEQDRVRWAGYVGTYNASAWGVLNPLLATGRIYEKDDHLYIDTGRDTGEHKLEEVMPGLFFADNGEALDLRGPTPTWRNIKMVKIEDGPSLWQKAILAGCALIFLSALLAYPVRGLVRRIRRPATARVAAGTGPWARLGSILAVLTSLLGLLSIAMLAAIPLLIYSGFLGWLELPAWQRLLLHAPLALAITVAGLLALNVPAWMNRWWSLGDRVHYSVLTLISVALVVLLHQWHLIGLGLG